MYAILLLVALVIYFEMGLKDLVSEKLLEDSKILLLILEIGASFSQFLE